MAGRQPGCRVHQDSSSGVALATGTIMREQKGDSTQKLERDVSIWKDQSIPWAEVTKKTADNEYNPSPLPARHCG